MPDTKSLSLTLLKKLTEKAAIEEQKKECYVEPRSRLCCLVAFPLPQLPASSRTGGTWLGSTPSRAAST